MMDQIIYINRTTSILVNYLLTRFFFSAVVYFVFSAVPFAASALQQTPPSPGSSTSYAPGVPTNVSAIAGNSSAIISFTPPSDDGGSTVMGFTVTSSGGQSASGTASPISIAGLTNGHTYNFTVSAFNNFGTGPASSVSNSVTPFANISLSISNGWNLIGNSFNNYLSVANLFGDSAQVLSVWKWDSTYSKWFFYSPSMTPISLSTYASNQGYEILTTINPGDGFWLNAASNFALQLPSGNAITNSNFLSTGNLALRSGWSLISIGQTKTPSSFNNGLSIAPPTTGTIANNLISLWAWDPVNATWYFYSPSLDSSGSLITFLKNQGYEAFTSAGLSPGTGFWVNVPTH